MLNKIYHVSWYLCQSFQEVNRCKSDQFQCRVGGTCVLSVYVCDGHWDCDNGADEADCGERRGLYEEYEKRGGARLAVPYVERWLDASAEACAMHCSVRLRPFHAQTESVSFRGVRQFLQ